jgi:beta-glucosidase
LSVNHALYRDPTAPIEDRVEHLLSLMTLDEKLAQLGCLWSASFAANGRFDLHAAIALMPHGIGQVTRIAGATGLRPRQCAEFMNDIQRAAIEHTRLGIPIFVHEEATGGFSQRGATVFPQALGLAATWNPALVERVAGVIREQMRAVGARLALAPVLDVARDPRWGRMEETYGEDPVLVATLATAFVRGLQTADLRAGVAATGKHFLAYAASDGGRNMGPSHIGPRELREVHAEPFMAVIRDAGLAAVMNSYATIDGIPCASSKAILTDMLRDELGFDGLVVSDYATMQLLIRLHHVAASPAEAARIALLAGLDTELPALDFYAEPLKTEVEAGRVPIAAVDNAVRRVLRFKVQLGLFEQPYVDAALADQHFQTPEQRAMARQAAAEAAILLKNDGTLPLWPSVRRLLVIGPGADDRRLLQGDYHYPAHQELTYLAGADQAFLTVPRAAGDFAPGPYYTPHVTPLAGLRAALGDRVEVGYERGCAVCGDDRSGFAAAVRAARQSDVAIVVLAGQSGLHPSSTVGEFNDAASLDLTGVQQDLLDALAATETPLVVVVLSGRVHALAQVAEVANVLLWLAPPGEEGGAGLADILTGAVNPSGRLPVSLPISVGQIPLYMGQRAGSYPDLSRHYVDSPSSPLFPFGHGLSYTSFAYSNLQVRATTTVEPLIVGLTVKNSGDRAGDEVVQLYVRDEVASVARPNLMLVGFTRVSLAAGEAGCVTFTVHPSRLAFYNPDMEFVVEPGTFQVSVGASAADLRLSQTVVLAGEVARYRQREIVATSVAHNPISINLDK